MHTHPPQWKPELSAGGVPVIQVADLWGHPNTPSFTHFPDFGPEGSSSFAQ